MEYPRLSADYMDLSNLPASPDERRLVLLGKSMWFISYFMGNTQLIPELGAERDFAAQFVGLIMSEIGAPQKSIAMWTNNEQRVEFMERLASGQVTAEEAADALGVSMAVVHRMQREGLADFLK